MKEVSLKCYRRYDNFYKFYIKLTEKFPFILIPRIPIKNPLVKFINVEKEFYDSRKNQLIHFLNFIKDNQYISQSKEFKKFISEASFDEDFFTEVSHSFKQFPYSFSVCQTIKNKLLGLFSNILGYKDQRFKTNQEKYLKKIELYYKSICEKYFKIKDNLSQYIKSIDKCSLGFKHISNTLIYMRDSLSVINQNMNIFNKYSNLSSEFSEINKSNYENIGKKIESDFEV